jgi:DNA-binding response OmpR family regulator
MKKQILVIEDEPVIAEMISIILEEEGFNVVSLADTARARKKLHGKEVNMAMLDINLAGETGKSLCKYIKSHKDLKDIPVILVSANMDIKQITEECGADDYIAKPFDLDHFIKKVHLHSRDIN